MKRHLGKKARTTGNTIVVRHLVFTAKAIGVPAKDALESFVNQPLSHSIKYVVLLQRIVKKRTRYMFVRNAEQHRSP